MSPEVGLDYMTVTELHLFDKWKNKLTYPLFTGLKDYPED